MYTILEIKKKINQITNGQKVKRTRQISKDHGNPVFLIKIKQMHLLKEKDIKSGYGVFNCDHM